MKSALIFLFVIFLHAGFSQNERSFVKGTTYTLYGKTIDVKNKLSEDKVFFTLEMDMNQKLTASEVQSIESYMQKDITNSFVVCDDASNKITFFTYKYALRHMDMIDYCKRMLALAGAKTAYNSSTEHILEFFAD